MTKIVDEDVIFKQRIVVPEISIEGGAGDLSIVDDIDVAGLATIGETLSVTGTAYLVDVTITGDVDLGSATIAALEVTDLNVTGEFTAAATANLLDVVITGTLDMGSATISVASTLSVDVLVASTIQGNTSLEVDCTSAQLSFTADNITAVCTTAYLSATDNIWSLAGYDQHVEASNVLVLDASTLNIGTETAFANEITIGKSADTAQNVSVYGASINVEGTNLVEVDASAINIGADSAYANNITIGNLSNTAQDVSVYAGNSLVAYANNLVTIDGGSLFYLGTGSATAVTLGNLAANVDIHATTLAVDALGSINIGADTAYANNITIGDGTFANTTQLVSVYGDGIAIEGPLVEIGNAGYVNELTLIANSTLTIDCATSINIATSYATSLVVGNSGAVVSVDASTFSLAAEAIEIGRTTTQANDITMGHLTGTSQTTSIYGANRVLIWGGLEAVVDAISTVNIGTATAVTVQVGSSGANVGVSADTFTLDASAINIGTDTAYAPTITIGQDVATTTGPIVTAWGSYFDAMGYARWSISGGVGSLYNDDSGLIIEHAEGFVSIDADAINVGTSAGYDNIITIGNASVTVTAVANAISVDGNTVNIGTNTAYANDIVLGNGPAGQQIDIGIGETPAINIGINGGDTHQILIGDANNTVVGVYGQSVTLDADGLYLRSAAGARSRAGYNADSDDNEIDHLGLNGAHGMLIVVDETNAVNGIFRLEGDEVISISANAEFTITKDTDTKINIYWEANDFHIQNCVNAGNMKITWSFYGVELQP